MRARGAVVAREQHVVRVGVAPHLSPSVHDAHVDWQLLALVALGLAAARRVEHGEHLINSINVCVPYMSSDSLLLHVGLHVAAYLEAERNGRVTFCTAVNCGLFLVRWQPEVLFPA